MKINDKQAVVEKGTSVGRRIKMGISQKSAGKLMYLMTNLYQDPYTAVIREVYTNAVDAHRKVGQSRPVEIYLPTKDNPLYVVRDWGVGMTEDDIEFVVSQYGESTKDESNEEEGAWGLGFKAPLAIASQFTVATVKDGRKILALVIKEMTGNEINILSNNPTDEENGTIISVAIDKLSEFNEKVLDFFQYSDPSMVLINGKAPTSILESARKIDIDVPGVELYTKEKNGYYNPLEFKLIMGNSPYALTIQNVQESLARTNTKFDVEQSKLSLYMKVSIGDVDLTPNREGLRYTEETKARIDEIIKAYVETIKATAQAEIDAVERRGDVFAVVRKWGNILDIDEAVWRGEKLISGVDLKEKVPYVLRTSHGQESTHGETKRMLVEEATTTVYGRDPKEYKRVNLYLTPYMEERNIHRMKFVFMENLDELQSPWFTDSKFHAFITAERLIEIGKAKRKADREAEKGNLKPSTKLAYPVVDLITGESSAVPYDRIPAGTPYATQDDFAYYGVGRWINELTMNGSGTLGRNNPDRVRRNKQYTDNIKFFTKATQLVLLGGSRKPDAFVKRVKGSYNIIEDIKSYSNSQLNGATLRVRELASIKGTNLGNLVDLIRKNDLESKLLDRDIRRLIKPNKKAKKAYATMVGYDKAISALEPHGVKRLSKVAGTSPIADELMEKYPLIAAMYVSNMTPKATEHMVSYINSIHGPVETADDLTPAS